MLDMMPIPVSDACSSPILPLVFSQQDACTEFFFKLNKTEKQEAQLSQ
jgi:hypothetical protein